MRKWKLGVAVVTASFVGWAIYSWLGSREKFAAAAESFGLTRFEFLDLSTKLLTALAVLLTAYYGGQKFLIERRDDRRWRKTELFARLAREFEADLRVQQALRLINEYRHGLEKPNLSKILSPDGDGLNKKELDDRYAFDRYLEFLDRCYTYVYVTKAIQPKDLLAFSYYAEEVRDIPPLCEYAKKCGFDAVLKLADRVGRERKGVGLASEESS
jgi:hypothetical protein